MCLVYSIRSQVSSVELLKRGRNDMEEEKIKVHRSRGLVGWDDQKTERDSELNLLILSRNLPASYAP